MYYLAVVSLTKNLVAAWREGYKYLLMELSIFRALIGNVAATCALGIWIRLQIKSNILKPYT